MKVLLTHAYYINEDPKEQAIMKPYVPLGILYLSAYLDEHKVEHEVFDSTFSRFDEHFGHIQNKQFDVVAIYTNLMTKLNVLKLIKAIKNDVSLKHSRILLGGPEVRNHAEAFLNYGADVLIVGEGEETLLEVVQHLQTGSSNWPEIAGTIILKEGKVHQHQERALVKDINTLPFPNRHRVDLTKYQDVWKKYHGYSMVSMSTMRGCPYTCKWCSRAVYGGTYRRRSAKLVVDEIEIIKRDYSPDKIWFVDDVFTINHKWLREFADELERRNVCVSYEIITRADRMNDEVIELLHRSGCFRVWIGAESGSQKIIDAMDRRVDVMKVREMIKKSRRAGIEAGTFIMLGYPGESRTDIKETIEHLVDAAPDLYTITVAYPIKGTRLYEEVQDKLTTSLNWAESTDRDLDFKRTHSRKYYDYAIRWVYNAVAASRTDSLFAKMKYTLKGWAMQLFMLFAS